MILFLLKYEWEVSILAEEKKIQNKNIKYSILDYVLFFFTFSFVGWIWEVILCLIQTGELVNRGSYFGPWLPIYGAGGILVLIFFRRFYQKPILLFFLSMIICSCVEYFTSCYLEYFNKTKWWDYSGFLFNLNGRICLTGAIIFGIGGCLAVYYIAPYLQKKIHKLSNIILITILIIVSGLFTIDTIYSYFNPNKGEGITIEET